VPGKSLWKAVLMHPITFQSTPLYHQGSPDQGDHLHHGLQVHVTTRSWQQVLRREKKLSNLFWIPEICFM